MQRESVVPAYKARRRQVAARHVVRFQLPPPTPPRQTVQVQLARALGLSTERLLGFTLTVEPLKPPLVEARYRVMSAIGLAEVTAHYRLQPDGQPQEVRDAA